MPPKVKISLKKTIKDHFKEILFNNFESIYTSIYQKHNLTQEKRIDNVAMLKILPQIIDLFFTNEKINFTSNMGINNIQMSYAQPCDRGDLGRIPSIYNMKIHEKCPDLLFYRRFNPVEKSIIRALYYDLNDQQFQEKVTELNNWLKTKNEYENKPALKESLLDFQNIEDRDNKEYIFKLLDLLSEFDNSNIVIYSLTSKKLNKNKNLLGPWFTSNNIKKNIKNKKISLIYMRVNSHNLFFEPIIFLDTINKNIQKYIEVSETVETTVSSKNYVPCKLHEHISNLINAENSSVKKVVLKKKDLKLNSINEIYFNPYDKHTELPIIQLNLKKGKKEFLLGHLLGSFRNIYDKTSNQLAGKVKIDTKTQNLDIYWCDDYTQ